MRLQSLGTMRRMVFVRLSAVAGVVSLIAIALMIVMERDRISERVVGRALYGTYVFNILCEDLLDKPGLPDTQAFVDLLNKLMRRGGDGGGSERLVFAGIYTAKGRRVAETLSATHRYANEIRVAMSRPHPGLTPAMSQPNHEILRIGGFPYIDVVAPLKNRAGGQVAYARALIQVTPDSLSSLWGRVERTVLFLVLTILAASVVLYPIITRLVQRLARVSDDLLTSNLGTLEVLGNAIAKRDCGTDEHNYRATIYCVRLAEARGLSPDLMRPLIKGALLHDVGKIGVRDHILLKPANLTPEEYEEMKRHVRYGVDIISRSVWLKEAMEIVGYHHEKFDGSGYDGRLSGVAIPLGARIFAIADVFDALTSERPYKPPLDLKAAMECLGRDRGTHFDPEILDTFLGIAQSLYERASARDGEATRRELQAILDHYYKEGVVTLL